MRATAANVTSQAGTPPSQSRGPIDRYSLWIGLALMFGLTWPLHFRLGLFVGYGLAAAALILTGFLNGKAGIREILGRFLVWRVGLRWYLAVLLFPLVLNLSAIVVSSLCSGVAPDFGGVEAYRIFGKTNAVWKFVLPFFLVDAITNGEELGWRGYALPRLQARFSALVSSLILGFIWGLWHLPRYLQTGDGYGFALTIAQTICAAVVYTWVFNGTGGSLLLVTLLHAAYNTAYVFLPVNSMASNPRQALIMVAVEAAGALVIVFIAGPKWLSNKEPVRQLA